MSGAPEPGAAAPAWIDAGPPDTRLQRALRYGGAALFVLVLSAGLLVQLAAEPVKTRATVAPPEWSFEAFRTGGTTRGLERWGKERSPLTYHVRGLYNEARFELGVLPSERVVFGTDGWLYVDESLAVDERRLEERRERRLAFLRYVRAMAEARGIRLLVAPAPDKPTIHPEHLPPGVALSPARRTLYDSILADLRAADVAFVDLRAPLLRAKAERPGEPLYHLRDTHWTLQTVGLAAEAIAAEVRARGFAELLGPPAPLRVVDTGPEPFVPDLVAMLGLRSETPRGAFADSPVVRRLQETRDGYELRLLQPDGSAEAYPTEAPDAPVALCGTSYSYGLLDRALPRALGVLVDLRGVVPGGGPFTGLDRVAEAIATGAMRPRLIVWEFVERDWTIGWLEPPGT